MVKGVSKPKPLYKVRAERASGKSTNADIARYGGTIGDGKTPKYKPQGVSIAASTVQAEKIKRSNQRYRDDKVIDKVKRYKNPGNK